MSPHMAAVAPTKTTTSCFGALVCQRCGHRRADTDVQRKEGRKE